MRTVDKSHLPEHLIQKQKEKGTYDSPCMSVCNYAGEFDQCQTCGMRKLEKVEWKQADHKRKEILLQQILERKI